MQIKYINQIGSAIVTALFITALCASLAIAIITKLQVNLLQTNLLMNNENARLYLQGSVIWAKEELKAHWQERKSNKLVDNMPVRTITNEKTGAKIINVIYDAQGFFNINNLKNNNAQILFRQLLTNVDARMDKIQADKIIVGIMDWMSNGLVNTSFDQFYAKKNPPYESAHALMVSATELRMIKDINTDLYLKLMPLLIALPETTPININNVSLSLLLSIVPGLNKSMALTIISNKKEVPFINVTDFLNLPAIKNKVTLPSEMLTTQSQYFLLKTDILLQKQHFTFYTLLKRITNNTNCQVLMIRQNKGTL